uniref:Uncharacterized protein n=1 Tax=Cacopsylla melanoneura TaxID=428564 RepID=A0A8D8YRY7_9HEMI
MSMRVENAANPAAPSIPGLIPAEKHPDNNIMVGTHCVLGIRVGILWNLVLTHLYYKILRLCMASIFFATGTPIGVILFCLYSSHQRAGQVYLQNLISVNSSLWPYF